MGEGGGRDIGEHPRFEAVGRNATLDNQQARVHTSKQAKVISRRECQLEKWEYLSVTLTWDTEQKGWSVLAPSVSFVSQDPNMGAALNGLGEEGWEAVNFVVKSHTMGDAHEWYESISHREIPGGYVTRWDALQFRVLMKRRKA